MNSGRHSLEPWCVDVVPEGRASRVCFLDSHQFWEVNRHGVGEPSHMGLHT